MTRVEGDAPALSCHGVAVHYGKAVALTDVDLDVAAGEIHAVVGPSGSGKTTLLRAVAGFERVAAGTICLAGRVVDDGRRVRVPPEERAIGVVFQEYALFPHLDVARNVLFGVPRARKNRASELLAQVGLTGFEGRRPTSLSGGEQQRVALARALAPNPGLVLLDEPFSNLDKGLRARLRAETKSVLRASGAAAILITHDSEEALAMGDRVSVIAEGRLRQTGTGRELYERPCSETVARCLGDACFLPASSAAGGDIAHTPLGITPVVSCADGEGRRVMLRPERVRVATGGEGVPARVIARTYLGHGVELSLALGEHVIRARVGPTEVPDEDDVVVSVQGPLPLL